MSFSVLFIPATLLRPRHCVPPRSVSPRHGPPRLSGRPPPQVKSSYYKNPSKAIEKGGGFYFPGLRGPRLRVAVATLTLALLSLNHLAAGADTDQGSLQVSEALAATAALLVFATATADISSERREIAAAEAKEAAVSPLRQPKRVEDIASQAGAAVAGKVAEEVSWAESVCADLTAASAFAVCRNGAVVHASGLAREGAEVGEAVARVSREKRALYIDDTATLPAEITLPFLPAGAWAVFLVPQEAEVVAFAKENGAGFDKRQRDWLTQMAIRMARGCR